MRDHWTLPGVAQGLLIDSCAIIRICPHVDPHTSTLGSGSLPAQESRGMTLHYDRRL